LGAFRAAFHAGKAARYGVLLIDIGAYTTDFGYVQFDESFYDDNVPRPEIVQLSREIGVLELDRAIVERLGPDVQRAISRTSTTEWETAKLRLYHKEPAAIRNPSGGLIKLGDGKGADIIVEASEEFADRVVQAKKDFRRRHIKGQIDAEVLTGGGAMIPIVRAALVKAMKADRGAHVYDLLDEDEPEQALRPKRGPSGWYYDQREVDSRKRANQELVRGGSAIGGCSVFFE
jgi:hypothetical protein